MAEHGDRPEGRKGRSRQKRKAAVEEEGVYDISISALGRHHRAGALNDATQLYPATHQHTAREWQVSCPLFFDRLRIMGFHMLYPIQYINLDINMITAMVERWSPSTNTFHLPIGEMTITLEDVQVILGLRVDGEPFVGQRLVGPGLRWATWKDCCLELLGDWPDPDMEFEDPDNNNRIVKFTMGATSQQSMMPLRWLRWIFCKESYSDLDELAFVRHVRAYCLYMIGCLLLPDTSGSHVPLQYLPLLEDVLSFGELSIGGAVLAHLYRELFLATSPTRVYIGGCLPLLQIWCWERFTIFRPSLNLPPVENLQMKPLSSRWMHETNRDPPVGNILTYRDALDGLRHNQVLMQPYGQDLLEILNPICRASSEICTARVPLISYKRVEWHLADRVMRQFGAAQSINIKPIDRNFHRHDGRGKAGVDWQHHHRAYIQIWAARRQLITPINQPIRNGREELTLYLTWYKSWASLYLSRPSRRSGATSAPWTSDDINVMEYIVRSSDISGRFSGDHGESQTSMQEALNEIHEMASRLKDSLSFDYDISLFHTSHATQDPQRGSTFVPARQSMYVGTPHNTSHEPASQSTFFHQPNVMSSTFDVGQSSQTRSPNEHHEFVSHQPTTMEIPDWMSPLGIPSNPSYQDMFLQHPDVEEATIDDDDRQQPRDRRPPERYTPGSGAILRRKR